LNGGKPAPGLYPKRVNLNGEQVAVLHLSLKTLILRAKKKTPLKTSTMSNNLENRVTSLEKSLRFYQMLLGGVVIITLAFVFSSFNNRQSVPEKIVAKAFEVVNDDGKVLASISSYNGNGAVTTYDKNGNYLVDVVSNTSGFGNINIYDGKGKPTLQLYNVKGGGGALAIKNKDGKDAVMLSLMTSGSGHLSLNSSSGSSLIWMGETTEKNSDIKMYNNSGRQVVRMASTNVSDGSIETFNNSGTRMVYLTTDVNGDGSVTTFNSSGSRNGRVPQ
jgi:hypothetical protein